MVGKLLAIVIIMVIGGVAVYNVVDLIQLMVRRKRAHRAAENIEGDKERGPK